MVKKLFYTLGLTALLVPAVALANENGAAHDDTQSNVQIGTSVDVNLNGDTNANENESVQAETHATTGLQNQDENMGTEENGSTTPGSMRHHEGDSEHADASSSMREGEDGGKDFLGLGAFFHWFFGLPASTTVGEIRAGAEASTSADVHGGSAESAPNFFADFMTKLSALFGF